MQVVGGLAGRRFAERLVEAVEARDLEAVCALQHPEIEIESAEARGLIVRGAGDGRQHAERILQENDMLAVALGSVDVLADDLLLVLLSIRSSTPGRGHRHDTQWLLWQLKDGLLWRQYVGTERELRALASEIT
jgi:hypothetical protein